MTLKQSLGKLVYAHGPFNRRTVNILRFEVGALWLRFSNALSPSYHSRVAKFRQGRELSINLGSGGQGKSGWVNVEISRHHADNSIGLDIRRPMPFASGSAARILAEHVVEHVDFVSDIPMLFSECHRILKAGGTLRVIVPDLGRYCRAYASGSPQEFEALGWDLQRMPGDIYTPMHILNHQFHQGGEHLFGWDFETLEWALRKAGFAEVIQQSFGKSRDPDLAIDLPKHSTYSLYVDATK